PASILRFRPTGCATPTLPTRSTAVRPSTWSRLPSAMPPSPLPADISTPGPRTAREGSWPSDDLTAGYPAADGARRLRDGGVIESQGANVDEQERVNFP